MARGGRTGRGIFPRRANPLGCRKCEATDFADCQISTSGNRELIRGESGRRFRADWPRMNLRTIEAARGSINCYFGI